MAHFEGKKHQHGGDFYANHNGQRKSRTNQNSTQILLAPFKRGKMHGSKNGVVLDLQLLGQENDVQLFTSLNTKRRQEPITWHSAPRRFPTSSQGLFP